ncbi:myosin light chain kinase domain containing protein, putative [Babesia caballi]|uniref:Myosin light chain kinase domain containing protein, putative n=1 Tax=Babesia caballi TaxID=5871 RepID=A0AAV4LMG0_BABCB|nr:myosin light chain kinase domain containing protein, putative [Babesia caballi]
MADTQAAGQAQTASPQSVPPLDKKWEAWFKSPWVHSITVAAVAVCLYLPDQVTSVGSKHMTVALNVSAANTGVYMTKLYATKTLANFTGSLITLCLQMLCTERVAGISCFAAVAVAVSRVVMLITFFVPDAAIYFYFAFIVQAFCRGTLESTFYPLAAEHMSAISLSYKTSKLIVWTLQVIMDLVISERPAWMMAVHLVLMAVISGLALIAWIVRCLVGGDLTGATRDVETGDAAAVSTTVTASAPATAVGSQSQTAEHRCSLLEQPAESDAQNSDEEKKRPPTTIEAFFIRLVGGRPRKSEAAKRCQYGCCNLSQELQVMPEATMWKVIKRVWSPFLMCMFGWPFKNFFRPGILPYSLVDRSKSHPLNITNMFFTFVVTMVVHFVKLRFPSLSEPWGKPPGGWHATWVLIVPPLSCMPFIYAALHYPKGVIYQGLRNNLVNVGIVDIIISSCTTVMDVMGYVGVAACSKDPDGKRGKNATRFIAMTSFIAQFVASFAYRMSGGYQIVRRRYVDDEGNMAPTEAMSWVARLWFWCSSTLSQAGYDFVHEFDGNIRDYV